MQSKPPTLVFMFDRSRVVQSIRHNPEPKITASQLRTDSRWKVPSVASEWQRRGYVGRSALRGGPFPLPKTGLLSRAPRDVPAGKDQSVRGN